MGYFDEAKQKQELSHHGILGQKWGVRRYQNPDGTLTEEGKKRIYGSYGSYRGNSGTYESPRSRNQRSIQGAKYARDIQKNQKKLDKAIASGNAKKIAKFSKADTILKTNRNIMLKDLSYDEIKMGEDYLKTMRNMYLGVLFGGIPGGVAAGLYTRHKLGSVETEKNVRAQDKARSDKFFMEEMNPGKDLSKDSEYNRLSKEAKGKQEAKDTIQKRQNESTSTDVKDRVTYAKKTNKFDMEFLEQNRDLDPRTGDQLKGKELYDAYEKWLKENQ